MMRKLLLAVGIVAATAFVGNAQAESGKYTASYVRDHAQSLLGQEVKLDVAWVDTLHRPSNETHAVVLLHTWDSREHLMGGVIAAVMPAGELEGFLKKYNTNPDRQGSRRGGKDLDTKRLTGTLQALGEKENRFIVDLSGGTIDLSEIKVEMKEGDGGGPGKGKPKGRGPGPGPGPGPKGKGRP